MVTSSLLLFFADGGLPTIYDSHADKVALIGMFSALGVALITGFFGYFNRSGGGSASRGRIAQECSAWERWLLLHGFDPRRIRTGYEEESTVLVVHEDDDD